MDSYKKYLKYKSKYMTLKQRVNQIGGNSNLDMNNTIYRYCNTNPIFANPCLDHFGLNLDDLKKMAGKDKSSQSDLIIGTSNITIDDTVYQVALKVFMSKCTTIKNRRIRPDHLSFFHEITICKQLTELFLIPRILQNISWFYYGGVCETSFRTVDNISVCSGEQITGSNRIYNINDNDFIKHWHDKYTDENGNLGDTTSFMVVEKSSGSLNSLFTQNVEKNTQLNLDNLHIFMSLILQTILTMNYINNNEFLVYFNHNDLHTGNVLYSPTSEEYITYNLINGPIRIRTYNMLAKIWDFGNSNLELTAPHQHLETRVNKSEFKPNKYVFIPEERKMCVPDIPRFMDFINNIYIETINPEMIATLSEEGRQIFRDIKFLVEYFKIHSVNSELSNLECGTKNREISNYIFNVEELNQILSRYIV